MSKQSVNLEMTPNVYRRRASDIKSSDWIVFGGTVWSVHSKYDTVKLQLEIHSYEPDKMRVKYINFNPNDEVVVVEPSFRVVN